MTYCYEGNMRITKAEDRNPDLIRKLTEIWEASVRATHFFLSDDEVKNIKEYVPESIRDTETLLIAEDEKGSPAAFMGIDGKMLSMLFISPLQRGKGLGKCLVHYGIQNYGISQVTVNEQNPQAVGFYEHMGFRVYRRTDSDEQGNPYPILYMSL